jgi:hypothetical protein
VRQTRNPPEPKHEEVRGIKEACYCGRIGEFEDREPILDESGRWALRCSNDACGHVDRLEWLPEEAGLLLWGEARRRRERSPEHRDAA